MARNLVYSWAERLWQKNPPRNHMPARWQQSHRSESQLFRNVKGNKLEDWYFVKQIRN